jgi:hypothetical protein
MPHRFIKRSAFGFIGVYNRLPANIVRHDSVTSFQAALQDMLKVRVQGGLQDWSNFFRTI